MSEESSVAMCDPSLEMCGSSAVQSETEMMSHSSLNSYMLMFALYTWQVLIPVLPIQLSKALGVHVNNGLGDIGLVVPALFFFIAMAPVALIQLLYPILDFLGALLVFALQYWVPLATFLLTAFTTLMSLDLIWLGGEDRLVQGLTFIS